MHSLFPRGVPVKDIGLKQSMFSWSDVGKSCVLIIKPDKTNENKEKRYS